jgi:hypothetical protein
MIRSTALSSSRQWVRWFYLSVYSEGNHEAFPCDQFGPNGATEWLYDEIATLWSEWLPSECIETIRYGGYYSMLVRPKLRFISINTQFGDIINFYVVSENSPA